MIKTLWSLRSYQCQLRHGVCSVFQSFMMIKLNFSFGVIILMHHRLLYDVSPWNHLIILFNPRTKKLFFSWNHSSENVTRNLLSLPKNIMDRKTSLHPSWGSLWSKLQKNCSAALFRIKEVCAQLNALDKRFKIWYIFVIRKPM